MPSQVWGRDPQEAYEEPYEYAAQEQFSREAAALSLGFYRHLNSDGYRFTEEDRSSAKAIWLLAMDGLDSLRDSLGALADRNHRVAAKLFRDVMESMDLAALFASGAKQARASLAKWYNDEIVPHREYRGYVKNTIGDERAEELRRHYVSLSRFTHRSYRALLDGYSLGGGGRLVHDASGELSGASKDAKKLLVLPHTIASYYAVLASLILTYADQIVKLGLLTNEQVADVFANSLESETVPRTFLPRRWLVKQLGCQTSAVSETKP